MFVENPLPPIKRRVPPIINTRTNKIEEKVAFGRLTATLTTSGANSYSESEINVIHFLAAKSPAVLQVFALQDARGVAARIWHFLNDAHDIAGVEIRITRLIGAALILAGVLFFSRMVSRLLQKSIAKKAYVDPGLRYTLGRLTQYLIIMVGILLALKVALSLDLTSIAVIFTALSVGIGFGLQYIAADIASGFILLFERPVRVGDRITIGEDEGDVQSINLRTTVVVTNDRVSIIVPNSRLVSQRLINWSYGDPRVRISIPVGVAYDSDIDLITQTLLKAAEDVDNVLKDPPPKVQFLKFGDWSLDFRLLVWTNRPRLHPQIKSDINYRLEKLFRESGIEIPFPQTEFRVREGSLPLDTGDKSITDDRSGE